MYLSLMQQYINITVGNKQKTCYFRKYKTVPLICTTNVAAKTEETEN